MRSGMMFNTVLGDLSFDKKGDVSRRLRRRRRQEGPLRALHLAQGPGRPDHLFRRPTSKPRDLTAPPPSAIAGAAAFRDHPIVCSTGKVSISQAVEPREEAEQEREAGEHQQTAHRLLDIGELAAKAREERRERLDRERRDDERHAEPERIDREQARALSPPSPRTPRPRGSSPGSGRCTASSRTRRRAPSHRRPTARPASASPCAPAGAASAIGVMPRKCRPMTMMAMPATIDSSYE